MGRGRSRPAGLSSIVSDCNVSAALPVATYSPVISPTVGFTFGMSRPMEMPATTAIDQQNQNTFRQPVGIEMLLAEMRVTRT